MIRRRTVLQCTASVAIGGWAGMAPASRARAECRYASSGWDGILTGPGNIVRCKGCEMLGGFTVEDHDDGTATYTLTAAH